MRYLLPLLLSSCTAMPVMAAEAHVWYPRGSFRQEASSIEVRETSHPDAIGEVFFHNEDIHPLLVEELTVDRWGITVSCTLFVNDVGSDDRLTCDVSEGFTIEPNEILVPEREDGVMYIFPQQLLLF